MQDAQSQKTFQSSDLNLCATLHCLGFHIKSMTRQNNGRVVFAFCATGELNEAVSSYWQGALSIEPIAHHQAIMRIKSQIYDSS